MHMCIIIMICIITAISMYAAAVLKSVLYDILCIFPVLIGMWDDMNGIWIINLHS